MPGQNAYKQIINTSQSVCYDGAVHHGHAAKQVGSYKGGVTAPGAVLQGRNERLITSIGSSRC